MAKDKKEPEVMNSDYTPAPEGFESESIGFPPYWNPKVGASFYGTVLKVDSGDPEFIRIQIRALAPILCAKGPAESAEPVYVSPGETFTVSDYVALPLKDYIGYDVWVKATAKIKGGQGTVWQWELKCSAETSQAVKARKLNAAKAEQQLQQVNNV